MRSQTAIRTRRFAIGLATLGTVVPLAATAVADTLTPDVSLTLASAHISTEAGHRAVVAGVAKGVNSGERLLLERHTRSGWAAVSHGSTRDGGAFRLRYTPHKAGSSLLRVRLAEADAVAPLHATVARAKTFRDALVSWYGPGFYGGPLACGGAPLGYNQLGVANKTLPCGTMVTIRYHGKSVRVPVIDRGPYVGDREFDLTRATKDSIGFDGVGVVKVSVAKS